MRRESSTVVVLAGALTGTASDGLLAGRARSPNVSVARAPAPVPGAGTPGSTTKPAADAPGQPAWEKAAGAMRQAARRRSTYVVVLDDPLADVAAGWSAMWDVAAGPAGAARFEHSAAEALAAWRARRFELPDYYVVAAPAAQPAAGEPPVPDLYLGPLRAMRPRRVAVIAAAVTRGAGGGITGAGAGSASSALLDTLRSLEHGPWWPPLDELLDAARDFYAGGLTEVQPAAHRAGTFPVGG